MRVYAGSVRRLMRCLCAAATLSISLVGCSVRATGPKPVVPPISVTPVSRGTAVHAEAADPTLKAALAALDGKPTAERHVRVGLAYQRLGVTDIAMDHFEAATKLNPSAATAWDGLARIWRDWGLPAQGLSSAYLAVFYAPRSAEAHNTLGTVLQAMENFEPARRQYEAAIALDPDAAWAWNNLCSLSRADGWLNKGVDACREALRLDPDMAVARANLEALERELGQ